MKGFESTSTMVPLTITPFFVKLSFAVLCTTFRIGHSNSTSVQVKTSCFSKIIHEQHAFGQDYNNSVGSTV